MADFPVGERPQERILVEVLEAVDTASTAGSGGPVPHKVLVPVLRHPHILQPLLLVGVEPVEQHSLDQLHRPSGLVLVLVVEQDPILGGRSRDHDLRRQHRNEPIARLPQHVQDVDNRPCFDDPLVLEPVELTVPEPRRLPGRGDVEPVVLEGSNEVPGRTHPLLALELPAEQDVIGLLQVRKRLEKRRPESGVDRIPSVEFVDRRGTVPRRVCVVVVRKTCPDCISRVILDPT